MKAMERTVEHWSNEGEGEAGKSGTPTLLSCKPYRALLTPRACAVNVAMAMAAERKWRTTKRWDKITDQEWERWLVCSRCGRSGMAAAPAFAAWKEVGWDAWEVLSVVYGEDGRSGRKGHHRTGAENHERVEVGNPDAISEEDCLEEEEEKEKEESDGGSNELGYGYDTTGLQPATA